MTTTPVDVPAIGADVDSLAEHEWAIPCDDRSHAGPTQPAVWAVTFRHGCKPLVFTCDQCWNARSNDARPVRCRDCHKNWPGSYSACIIRVEPIRPSA